MPPEIDGLAIIAQEFGITPLAAMVWMAYLRISGGGTTYVARKDPAIVGYGARLSDF